LIVAEPTHDDNTASSAKHAADPPAPNQTGTNTLTSFASSITSSAAAGPGVTGWSAWKKFAPGISCVALSRLL
jgi:hypothetical protein